MITSSKLQWSQTRSCPLWVRILLNQWDDHCSITMGRIKNDHPFPGTSPALLTLPARRMPPALAALQHLRQMTWLWSTEWKATAEGGIWIVTGQNTWKWALKANERKRESWQDRGKEKGRAAQVGGGRGYCTWESQQNQSTAGIN